ncbi:MAG TPA: protein kinase [Candidatus Acidoferrales bacterium]|nr:protein kinase [Candidatus Acidoferrales bacterium]HTS61011.1 protein kinase [Candidatus Acidoferrales bacterium]
MEFELGSTYSGYKFLDVVARSRSAVVYRVENTLAQRVEVLTALPAGVRDDRDAAERLLREMRIRARLCHPHVVTFYTALPLEGQLVMTTELFESVSLAERLKLGPLPWREALAATRQVLAAVGAGHDFQVIHRGITPANILFGPNGIWKLTNYSLAYQLNNGDTESGSMVGDPHYISPEQVKGAQDLDHRSDLYSVGTVLYEMITGRPPFDSRSQFELMLAHVNQRPPAPSAMRSGLPRFLDFIVLKALAKEPAARYQSAAEFAGVLLAAGSETPETVAEAETSAVELAAAPAQTQSTESELAPFAAVVAKPAEPVAAVVVQAAEPVAGAQPAPVCEATTRLAVAQPSEEPPDPAVEAAEPGVEAPAAAIAQPAQAAEAAAPEVPETLPVAEPAETALVASVAAEPEVPAAVVEAVEVVAVEPAPVEAVPGPGPQPVAETLSVESAGCEPMPVEAVPAVEPAPATVIEPVVEVVAVEAAPVEPTPAPEPAAAIAIEPAAAETVSVASTAREPVATEAAEVEAVPAEPTPLPELVAAAEIEPVAPENPPAPPAAPEPVAAEAAAVESASAEPTTIPEPVATAAIEPVAHETAPDPSPVPEPVVAAGTETQPPAEPAPTPEPAAAVLAAEAEPPVLEPVVAAAVAAAPVEEPAPAQDLVAPPAPVETGEPAPVMAAAATANGKLQGALWQAAAIVAQAAVVQPPALEPESEPVPVRLASEVRRTPALSPAPAPQTPSAWAPVAAQSASAPVPVGAAAAVAVALADLPAPAPAPIPNPAAAPAPVPESANQNIPALIAAARGGFDRAHWIIFGSTAAFLTIIWLAIWLAAGK